MTDNYSISVVIPILNEEESIEKLYSEISVALGKYSAWEIIFVDDGSDDGSFKILQKIADSDHRITIIHFYKNFGKSDALSEGFKQTKGDIIITMDGDLQEIFETLQLENQKLLMNDA